MKDLQKLANECLEELDVIGVEYGNIVCFKANNRYTSKYGNCLCHYNGDKSDWTRHTFEISIATFLLDNNVPNKVTRQVIMHEIAHSCEGCMNHGKNWLAIADLISDCYGLDIQQYVTTEEKSAVKEAGVAPTKRKVGINWVFECPNCAKEWKYKRRPSWVKNGYDPITNKVLNVRCPYCKEGIYMVKYGDLKGVAHTYQF